MDTIPHVLEVVRIERVVLPFKDLETGRPQLMWTVSTAPTWENENFIIAIIIIIIIIITIIIAIIIIVIIIFVVVVVGDNTYYGVTCPQTVHFKFITKYDKCYYKVRQNKVSVLKRFTESDCWAALR